MSARESWLQKFGQFGNSPFFSGVLAQNLRGQLQFLGGRYAADAHVRSFMVVSP